MSAVTCWGDWASKYGRQNSGLAVEDYTFCERSSTLVKLGTLSNRHLKREILSFANTSRAIFINSPVNLLFEKSAGDSWNQFSSINSTILKTIRKPCAATQPVNKRGLNAAGCTLIFQRVFVECSSYPFHNILGSAKLGIRQQQVLNGSSLFLHFLKWVSCWSTSFERQYSINITEGAFHKSCQSTHRGASGKHLGGEWEGYCCISLFGILLSMPKERFHNALLGNARQVTKGSSSMVSRRNATTKHL